VFIFEQRMGFFLNKND